MWRYSTPGWNESPSTPNSSSSASMTLRASSEARMTAGEVLHGAVVADRHQIAPVGDLVARESQTERSRLDRCPAGVIAAGVVAEDRHVPDVAAGWQTGRDDGGATHLTLRGEASPGSASTRLRAACGRPTRRAVRRHSRRGRRPRTSSGRSCQENVRTSPGQSPTDHERSRGAVHASVIAPFSAPCARRAYFASTPDV